MPIPQATTSPEGESLSSLAFAATVTALRLWGKVLMSILIPTTNHSLVYAKEGWGALEPSLKQSIFWFVYDTSLTFKFGVFMGFVALFVIWLLEREIKRRRVVERVSARVKRVTDGINATGAAIKAKYVAVRAEIERESRIAAQLLPHFLYVIATFAVLYFMPEALSQISRGFGAWSIIVGWPVAWSTIRMLKHDEIRRARLKKAHPEDADLSSSEGETDNDDDTASRASSSAESAPRQKQKAEVYIETMVQYVRKRLLSDASLSSPSSDLHTMTRENVHDFDPILDWLRYWSVLSVCLFFEQFPFTGHFLSVIPIWPEIRLSFALWLQLPVTRGCDWAFTGIVPLLDRYVKKIVVLSQHEIGNMAPAAEQSGMIIRMLLTMGLITKKTKTKLVKATETNGTLIMLAVPFMLSPSFITKIGVLVVGLAFPAHSSASSILEIEQFKAALKKKDRETDEEEFTSDAGESAVFWLEYWVVYVIFALLHAPLATMFGWWFPLWDQFHLGILLWMQISYFSGAHNIFKIAVVISRVWRRRRRAQARMRRRASSVATPQEKIENIVGSLIPFASPVIVGTPSPTPSDDGRDSDADTNDDDNSEDLHQTLRQEENISLKGDRRGSAASERRRSSVTQSRQAEEAAAEAGQTKSRRSSTKPDIEPETAHRRPSTPPQSDLPTTVGEETEEATVGGEPVVVDAADGGGDE